MMSSDNFADRREFFRVAAAADEPVRVYFRLSGDLRQVFLARVDTISVGGIGIVLNLFETPGLPTGVGSGVLLLPGLGRVSFSGQIEWNNGARLGLRFVEISEKDKSLIFRYVVKREREAAQVKER